MSSPTSRTFDVAIVGAGVIGCSIAYHLAKKSGGKLKIAVAEKRFAGAETSSGAAGMIAAQIECETQSPFAQLCAQSRALFPQISQELKNASGIDVEYAQSGIVEIAWNAEQEISLKNRMKWQNDAGMKSEWLSPDDLLQRFPFFKKGSLGGFWVPEDGQVSASRLTAAFAESAKRLGVQFFENENVSPLNPAGAPIASIQTSQGELKADKFIFAGGPWTGEILKEVARVSPVKGQILSFEIPGDWPAKHSWKAPVYFGITPGAEPIHCYFVPKKAGHLLLGATMEHRGFDAAENKEASRRMRDFGCQVFPELAKFPFTGVWTGFRPGTADGLPLLGSIPGSRNAYVASGHLRNGILLSPITGQLIAELLLEGKTSLDLSPFSPERFLKIA